MATLTPEYLQHLRNDIEFEATLRGHALRFHSTWGLFSPREVDEGSRLLLEHVEVSPDDHCLDLGCGYGAIGLTLAKLVPDGSATLVDKDFVAIDYSRKNAQVNQIPNVEVLLSNGLSAVSDRRFDLITSNLPAKTGKELLYLFCVDALASMQPGARLYVVTINGLRRFIQRAFQEIFGNYDKVKQGRNYTVGMAVRPP